MSQSQENGLSLLVQGRIIWTSGDLFKGKPMTDDHNRPVLGQDGNQKITFGFGLAVLKYGQDGQPTKAFQEVWQALHGEAYKIYPNGLPADFAMKYKDGDTAIDQNGQPYANREGYKGHIVLSCTTQIAIRFFKWEGGNNIMVNDGIKNGDYVNVQLNIKAHPPVGRGKPGLYLNPSFVQLIQAGKEIVNTPSGDQMFGTSAPSYNGVVEAPVINTPNLSTPAPQYGQPAAAPMPQQQYAAPAPQAPAPQAAPAPHYGAIPQNLQPTPQAAPVPQYAQPAPQAPVPQAAPAAAPMPGGMPPMPR